VLAGLGLRVAGSDGCGFAVQKARELAAAEGQAVQFFSAPWAELPERTTDRFEGVFNDALSWIVTRGEFESALRGLCGALKPGGVLVFMGAAQDSPADPESRRQLFESEWQRRPRFSIEWQYARAGVACTSVLVREKGEMYVDEHHIFLIAEGGVQRLETATIRQPVYWHWPLLLEMVRQAGFSRLETRTFPGLGAGGTTFKLNVATR